ncbi:unnamed protein product [Prunus armeniaca]
MPITPKESTLPVISHMDTWHPLRKFPESHIDTQLEVHTLQESINRGTNPQKKGTDRLLVFPSLIIEEGSPGAFPKNYRLTKTVRASEDLAPERDLESNFSPTSTPHYKQGLTLFLVLAWSLAQEVLWINCWVRGI